VSADLAAGAPDLPTSDGFASEVTARIHASSRTRASAGGLTTVTRFNFIRVSTLMSRPWFHTKAVSYLFCSRHTRGTNHGMRDPQAATNASDAPIAAAVARLTLPPARSDESGDDCGRNDQKHHADADGQCTKKDGEDNDREEAEHKHDREQRPAGQTRCAGRTLLIVRHSCRRLEPWTRRLRHGYHP
jgi:hypothetical protein